MKRVEGQINDKEELAKQVLMWISCAKRPLRTLELQHALAVEVGDSELDDDNIPQVEDMVSVCAGLVTVDEESGIIRLVHYTTQEYFERTQNLWFSNADSDIVKICVTYLLFDVFASEYSDEEDRNSPCALYKYAAAYWGHHARKVSTLLPEVMEFLNNTLFTYTSAQEIDFLFTNSFLHYEFKGLELAAYFGLENAVITLLNNEAEIDRLPNSNVGLSLVLAAVEGHEAIVRLLVKAGVKISSMNQHLKWYVAVNGHTNMLKLLIDAGAQCDSKDPFGKSSLHWAAQFDQNALIDHVIDSYSIDVNVRDDLGETPLMDAAKNGHGATVKRLLERGADADWKDEDGWTPLLHATWNKQVDVVKILLASSVNPNATDKIGRTAFFYAILRGSAKILEILIADDRIKRDSKDQYGMTPLTITVIQKWQEVMELLLATSNVNPDSQDYFGRTLLWWARRCRNDHAERLLLDYSERKCITLNNHNLPVTNFLPTIGMIVLNCEVCTLGISKGTVWYSCEFCHCRLSLSFSICSECKAVGAHCLDSSHVFSRRICW